MTEATEGLNATMASTTANRVLYRSPDALQNLRVKVSLTRVSGLRAAARSNWRRSSCANEARRAARGRVGAPRRDDGHHSRRMRPSRPSDNRPTTAPPTGRPRSSGGRRRHRARALPATRADPGAARSARRLRRDRGRRGRRRRRPAATSYAPQVSSRRARSFPCAATRAGPAPSTSTFDPYGAPPTAPAVPSTAGPVTESAAVAPRCGRRSRSRSFRTSSGWLRGRRRSFRAPRRRRARGRLVLKRSSTASTTPWCVTHLTARPYTRTSPRTGSGRPRRREDGDHLRHRAGQRVVPRGFRSPRRGWWSANARRRDATAKRTEPRAAQTPGRRLPVTS